MEKTYKSLSSLGRIITGKTPPTENEEYYDGPYPFITPSDISSFSDKYLTETERTISTLGVETVKNCKLPENSTCFVCIGSTIGKMCMTKSVSYTNQQLNSIIPNDEINPHYLFYCLRNTKEYFQSIGGGTGSGKGIVNKTLFSKTKIEIIENNFIQDRIASILSTYDRLIETNNKRIKTLEQMAENLYKEWFVRFRFPGHETVQMKESSIGKIPFSFSVEKMGKVIADYIGGGWGNDEEDNDFSVEAYVIRGTDFPNVKKGNLTTCPLRYHKKSNYNSRELKALDIILEVSGGTAEQPVGRTLLVTQDVIDRLGGKVICASFCKQLRLNQETVSPLYFYHWMQYLYDTRIIERYQLQSTGIINFQFEYFYRKGFIMLPPKELMKKFDATVYPLIDEITLISKQNENLIKQRDLLLPRLMSGKLEVE